MITIGIMGHGFVGSATALLKCFDIDVIIYDICPEKCDPIGTTLRDMAKCDLIFVCVPTPMMESGKCHLGIVEKAVSSLKDVIDENKTQIIIRSTVPPGTSKFLNCYFMPEFLTERNWPIDFKTCQHWIVGLLGKFSDYDVRIKMYTIIQKAKQNHRIDYDNLHFVLTDEAELTKYCRNTFLSVKVSFFNEIYEYCQSKGINFENVREMTTYDPRIGTSHSFVPGPDGKLGYGGTCFPKDTNALYYNMKEIGMESYMTKATVERNSRVDRPIIDGDKGRAFI
jgi:UDPglucose 6-dehydrogenase